MDVVCQERRMRAASSSHLRPFSQLDYVFLLTTQLSAYPLTYSVNRYALLTGVTFSHTIDTARGIGCQGLF